MSESVRRHETAVRAAAGQQGAISIAQLKMLDWTDAMIRTQMSAARWQRIYCGIFVVYTGELAVETRWWAAHLRCGPNSVLTGESALQAWKLGKPTVEVHVAIPNSVSPRIREETLVLHRYRNLRPAGSPKGAPPTVTLPHAVIEVTNLYTSAAKVIDLVNAACNRSASAQRQLQHALESTRGVKHRKLIEQVLRQQIEGVTSPLEGDGVQRILVDHGLPRGRLQKRERTQSGVVVRDCLMDPYPLILEFDGYLGHADASSQFRDEDRDNYSTLTGRATLRFGWVAVHERPCRAAQQVAIKLRQFGWPGKIEPCGPACEAIERQQLP